MNLLGLNQNLANIPKADKLSESVGKSVPSNQSSEKFQNTLDRFSKNSEKNESYSASKSSDRQLGERQEGRSKLQEKRLPDGGYSYRKPGTSIGKSLPHQNSQGASALAEEQIQSKINGSDMAVATPKNATVDSLTRRAAIQSFMQKMETKLGIEPSDIVQAFQQLSVEELAAPPEQNVDKIISFLDLDLQQQQIARTFFDEMLAQSSAQSIAEYLKATDRELSLSVMSQNQMRQERLQKGLTNMNQQFFTQTQNQTAPQVVNDPQQSQTVTPEFWAASGAATGGTAGYVAGSSAQTTSQLVGNGQAGASGLSSMVPQMQNFSVGPDVSMPAVTQEASTASSTGMPLGKEWSASASEGSTMNASDIEKMVAAGKNSIGKSAYGLNPQVSSSQSMTQKSMGSLSMSDLGVGSPESGAQWQMSGAAGNGQQQTSTGEDGQSMSGSNSGLQDMANSGEVIEADGMEFQVKAESSGAAATSSNAQSTVVAKSPSFMLSSQPTDAEQAQNMKEVVSQANLLVKKGGGEMKIALNPEGIGQVNLKVAVQDGQVSVEMVTESNEAKKILEKGLGDLKANLASHKLNVDNVKVDFSGEVAKQFDHAHDEAQRQSAQNFMEQFRHQNQSWRQNFFDIPGGGVSEHPNEGGPQDELTQVQNGQKKSSSRRLDLVA